MGSVGDAEKARADQAEVVFRTEWFTIDIVGGERPDGKPYYRMSSDDTAQILAITTELELIMVRQFRPAIGEYTLEFPAGYVDKGETPEEAIRRELVEETGYLCEDIVSLGFHRIVPSRMNRVTHLFFGRNAEVASRLERGKPLEVMLLSPEEFRKMIRERKYGVISCIANLYLAEIEGLI